MPYYEWQRSDPFKDYANDRTITEGEVVELSQAIADPQAGFVEVEEPDTGGETSESDADESTPEAESSAENTPLAEKHWRTAVSEIEDGEYDDRLGELAENDDLTDSVREAVEERQAELGE